jgi:hypothetical protein
MLARTKPGAGTLRGRCSFSSVTTKGSNRIARNPARITAMQIEFAYHVSLQAHGTFGMKAPGGGQRTLVSNLTRSSSDNPMAAMLLARIAR